MSHKRLRVVFFGETDSTFSHLHYAVLQQQTEVLLWVTSRSSQSGGAPQRQAFRSVRDWYERLVVRMRFEYETLQSLHALAALLGKPDCSVYLARRNDLNLRTILLQLEPDLIFSAGFRRILPPAILAVPTHGAFNCHPSPLPRYAGSNPWFWILRNGETQSAVTIHRMVAAADAGNIILQKQFCVEPDANQQQLYNRSSLLSALLLKEYIGLWNIGTVREHPQDLSQRTYFSTPQHQDYRIDWTWSLSQIINLVRAAQPSPGAWATVKGREFTILHMTTYRRVNNSESGVVVRINQEGLSVACADGVIQLEIIVYGGKEIQGYQIAQALRLSVGERLD